MKTSIFNPLMALAVLLSASWLSRAQDAYEPDNTAGDAKVITKGQMQNRSIHQAGNVDWAKFTIGASGASNVRIETDGASGDTEMWLYGPNSSTTQKDYDDDDGNGAFSLITQTSLAGRNVLHQSHRIRQQWNNRGVHSHGQLDGWVWRR